MIRLWWSYGLLLGLTVSVTNAQELQLTTGRRYLPSYNVPNCPPCPSCPTMSPLPSQPTTPSQPTLPKADTPGQLPEQPVTDPSQFDTSAQATEQGTQASASLNPAFFGDFIGFSGTALNPYYSTIPGPNGTIEPHRRSRYIRVPIPSGASGFKIAEGESPRPTDRVFYLYNFYNDINLGIAGLPVTNFQRQIIGFEKTFLNGDASIGMRLPFLQLYGPTQLQDSTIGDLSIIFKYALLYNRDNGNTLSGGMVLTVPTGADARFFGLIQDIHPTVIQPFLGYIYNVGSDLYLQGFSSLSVPTDSRDVTILFNSLGAGYWLYRNNNRNRWLTGIVPVLEGHLNTPLNRREPGFNPQGIFFQDQFNMTAGSYFLFHRAQLGAAVCVPLVGPRPYAIEAIASFNFRF